MNFIKLIFLAALSTLLLSCADEDDGVLESNDPITNTFTVNGTSYELNYGEMFSYEKLPDENYYRWVVNLTSFGPTGNGDYINFQVYTNSANGIPNGTYEIVVEEAPMTLHSAYVAISFDPEDASGDFYFSSDSGTLTVSTEGEQTILSFDIDLIEGDTLTGQYMGVLELTD